MNTLVDTLIICGLFLVLGYIWGYDIAKWNYTSYTTATLVEGPYEITRSVSCVDGIHSCTQEHGQVVSGQCPSCTIDDSIPYDMLPNCKDIEYGTCKD